MADEPRPDVLAERIAGIGNRLDSMDRRLDGLATKDELANLMQGSDRITHTRLTALTEDVKELTAALATERIERMAADRENEERANRARTFALSAIGLGVTIVLGLVALISQIGSAPT